ncbi:NAD(P)-binding protein [Penicillium angulare]|uniref:NAD(P)-binding protein n=1 Tax=Penicillium angulare TaxID=116970 RepID=A0A9W9FC00_9EURO|nr:NAD(P)-binding protein [Penicillium angulare]
MALAFFSRLYDTLQAFRGIDPTFIPDDHVPGKDLTGKWIIITGGNSGIGFEAAKSFSKWGANIIFACREPPAYEQHPKDAVNICSEISQTESHSSIIEWWEIDLTELKSVELFCQKWLATDRTLDILCNNAGVPAGDPTRMTNDGFQWTHQINLLAPVLMTLRLLPSLAKSAEPRIICTVSAALHQGQLDFENFNGGPNQVSDYNNNKLFFQMWIAEMQSRFLRCPEYLHITINGVNPGLVLTPIWRSTRDGKSIVDFLKRWCGITPRQGSFAITYAATSPELGPDHSKQGVGAPNGRGGGRYFNRVWEAPAKHYCNDLDARLVLWAKLNEELYLKEKGLLSGLGA